MYCSKCGAFNPDDAAYCKNCGAQIQAPNTTPQGSHAGASPYSPGPSPTAKSPIIAAILNLFFGIGYLYLGYRRVLNVPTTVFVIVAVILYVILGLFTVGILSLLIAIVLAIDGYQKGEGQRGFILAEM
jgi:hypothetical protein